jgi:hypothetical protein
MLENRKSYLAKPEIFKKGGCGLFNLLPETGFSRKYVLKTSD